MGLKDDAKAVISEMLGSTVAAQVDSFEDPKKYPKEFIEECIFFLGRMMGDDIARKKFEPIMRKYIGQKGATGNRTHTPATNVCTRLLNCPSGFWFMKIYKQCYASTG